ncbi:Acyl carrier protein phosphodiesterase [Marinobacter nitratireducens]|uniref:Acyl carrier protein phosphodiesterase n=1 Tax=Marinobacter nitratireducens TaxID=1137280 RepID=A0A072NH24_9GAMM|nr:ACP phosphodiesterase [Marinobacter nitratireducens]KEF32430.1 Acyl carrier protein phosphodiesterase [Marinobacter nitratireducens]
MNYLAHAFLAPDSAEARVGSILGDFTRGVDLGGLPADVLAGVRHHRAIDAFTDRHPAVLESKQLFSRQRRRFAGVALDILYDHYLLRHWERYANCPRDRFINLVYCELQEYEQIMPATMLTMSRRMVSHDWFSAYADLDNVGYALDRVAGRLRFPNGFAGIIEEIRESDRELEYLFLEFFPDLQSHAGDI